MPDEEWFYDEEVPCQNPGCYGTATWSGGAQKRGKPAPRQCQECYEANRDQADEVIVCANCKEEYTYRARSIIYYRRNVAPWKTPNLCRFCTEHPDLHPIDLDCQNAACTNTFVFSPRWQQKIADKNQQTPVLCDSCRQANKTQQEVRLKCSACETDYTYSKFQIINFKRQHGWFEGRTVCRLCFEDPQRAKRLKEEREKEKKKEEDEKEKRRREDIVGYYLLEEGTDEENAEWEGIVDENTYEVTSNVQSYEILTGEELYARIVEIDTRGKSAGRSTIARDHILYGKEGKGHGWDDLSFDEVLGQAGGIAEDTDSSIIECRDRHTDYIIKYDTNTGVLVIICESEDEVTRWRVKTTYQPSQEDAAKKIRSYSWILA